MAGKTTIDSGSITNAEIDANAGIARTKLDLETATYSVPLQALRTWDDRAVNLPAAAAADDCGIVTGTLGTDMPSIQSGDLKAANTTRYFGLTFCLPAEYQAGQAVTLRVSGGMKTTVSDTTATADFQVYRSSENLSVGADICATSATSINSLTFSEKDYTITATTLNPGDELDIRGALAVNDAATGTAVIACIAKIEMLCSVKG